MNDILLSPIRLSELEHLIEKSVQRALAKQSQAVPDAEPYGDFNWLRTTVPYPESTLRIKSAAGEIPGLVKFGKRVLYDKSVVLNWLRSRTLDLAKTTETAKAAEEPNNLQLRKKSRLTNRKK